MATLDVVKQFRSQPNSRYDALIGQLEAMKGSNARMARAKFLTDSQARQSPAAVQPGTVRADDGLKTDVGTVVETGGAKVPDAPVLMTPEQLSKDSYQFNQELLNYLDTPLTAEERQRRERAAHAVAGVGALGNVLSAFSNLAFTGAGAPSQTLPTAPDAGAAVSKERERWDRVAREYTNALMQGRSMDLREWQQAQQMENERVRGLNEAERARYQANVQRYGLEYQRERDAIKDENDRKRFDMEAEKFGWQKQNADRDYELRKRGQEIQAANAAANQRLAAARERREQERHNYMMNNGLYGSRYTRTGGGGGKASVGELLSSPSNSYRVNAKLSTTEVANLYRGLPEEVRSAVEEEYPGFGVLNAKEREGVMREAIAGHIAENDDYAEMLAKRGYLTRNVTGKKTIEGFGSDSAPKKKIENF